MYNLKRYTGWALITGASAGIGREFARIIAADGVNCVLVARRRDRLDALAEELSAKHGVQCRVVEEDLVTPGAAQRVYDATADLQIGLLINNAGTGAGGFFHEGDRQRLLDMVTLNCHAVTELTHRFLPQMIARKNGAILIVSSVLGIIPTPYDAVYGATKAFDLSLGEALWAELQGTGVDVTVLCPGGTKTEFLSSQGFSEARLAKMNKTFAAPEKIAAIGLRKLGTTPSCGPFDLAGASFVRRFLSRKMTARIVKMWTSRFYDIH